MVFLLALLLAQVNAQTVEQIHLSWGEDEPSMVVSWATPTDAPSIVHYGLAGDSMTFSATGTSEHFKQSLNDSSTYHLVCDHCVDEYFHQVTLSDLKSGREYQYQIDGSDSIYHFHAKNISRQWSPTFAVYGDLGTLVPDGKAAASDDTTISPSIKLLNADIDSGKIDGVLHVGDFAYDFWDNGGQTGDTFMREIESIAARLPYMTCLGNHEGGTSFAGDLHHYIKRFNMPGRTNGVYYSFDIGPAHIISFSSEAYFWQLWEVEQQFAWLQKDLESVDRSKTPFVITMAHRPMYCSNLDGDDCTKDDANMRKGLPVLGARFFALEPLFNKHGVDLSFWAHEHSYERMWPVYDGTVMNGTTSANPYHNPKATTHIVTGAAGCREGHDAYKGPRGPWSAVRNSDFGYGRLHFANNTHLHWEQIEDQEGSVVDELWLIKDHSNTEFHQVQVPLSSQLKAQEHREHSIFQRTQTCLDRNQRLPECGKY